MGRRVSEFHEADKRLVLRWLVAMADLRLAADPMPGRTIDMSVSKSAERPLPGQSTRRYRNAVRRMVAGLERECEKAELALDDPSPPKGRLRCPKCGRGGRPGAEICDRRECAGTELEER